MSGSARSRVNGYDNDRFGLQGRLDLSYSYFFARNVINDAGGGDVRFLKLQLERKF